MKSIKLVLALGLISGAAQAATITVSAGLTAQGVTPLLQGIALPAFFTSVGLWNSGTSTFTPFGTALADTGEVNGAITATGPSTFNNGIVAVFVGTGADIASSAAGGWAVFTSTAATTFPPDVSAATGVTFAMTTPAVLNVVGRSNANGAFTAGGVSTNNFSLDGIAAIPEPSAALLGAIGVLGLLRRRRN